MTAQTFVTTDTEAGAAEEVPSLGHAAAWWYDWVNRHRVGAIALVGVIATQLGTYFGYVFPAIGLPTLPWPLFNGVLGRGLAENPEGAFPVFNDTGSYFVGQSLHFVNGIVFAILYAVLARPAMPFKNTHSGHVASGLTYGLIMTIISVGLLVPYAYVPEQGYGFFLFDGPDGWKLPFAVLIWHLIYGFFLGTLYQFRNRAPSSA
ncbi:MAG: hypothetical protein ACRD2C_01390 [Acidimicrobiales bacterium]